jgi:starch-binding outer membrane protein SusE/F
MKLYKNLSAIFLALLVVLAACKKDEVKVVYSGGTTPTLSTSVANLNMVPGDSNANVFSFSWTDPAYTISTGTNSLDVTYTIEVDSATKNFANAKTFSATDALSISMNGRTLNKLMTDLGYTDSSKGYSLQARLKASMYVASSQMTSNTVSFTVSPYSTKPVALYPVPDELFIVGDALAGGWTNPVPVPSQKFTRLDEFTFGGIFQLTGAKKYLLLPNNGSWNKYAVANASAPGMAQGGDFIVNAGQDIPSPAASGLYKIVVNFVTGKYAVTEVTGATDIPPANLFIVGDATAGAWANPVPVPSQQFTQVSSAGFSITLPLQAAKKYLLLPTNGIWDKYAVANAAAPGVKEGGTLVVNTGQDIPSPDLAGTYKIEVEFINKTYKVTKQ